MIYTIKNKFGLLEFINQDDIITITIKDGGGAFIKYFEVELNELARVIELLDQETPKINIKFERNIKEKLNSYQPEITNTVLTTRC